MESIFTLEATLEGMDSQIIYKNRRSIWSGVLITLAGFLLFIPLFTGTWSAAHIGPPLFIALGTTVVTIGLIRTFFRKYHFVDASDNKQLHYHEINFDAAEFDKLMRLYRNGQWGELKNLKRSSVGNLRLRFYLSRNKQLCFSQPVRFVDFEYRPEAEVLRHSADEAILLKELAR